MSSPPIDIKRPPGWSSGRGVRIREADELECEGQNPIPFCQDPDEADQMYMEEYLSPRRLRILAGVEDLSKVKSLEMKVDALETSLGNFGNLVPNLEQLKLNHSHITSMRDLGSSLDNLQILWMSHCELGDLDGVSTMTALTELYLPYNLLTDISPLSLLSELIVIDLEGNCLEEMHQVEFLCLCTSLKKLTLDGNPLCCQPCANATAKQINDFDYRKAVVQILPQLSHLDDVPVSETRKTDRSSRYANDEDVDETPEFLGTSANFNNSSSAIYQKSMSPLVASERSGLLSSVSSGFHDDWKLIEDFKRDGTIVSGDSGMDSPARLKTASSGCPSGNARPYTASSFIHSRSLHSRPSTASPLKPVTPERPMSSRQSSVASSTPSEMAPQSKETISDLLKGGVVCGNPFRALRAKQKSAILSPNTSTDTSRLNTPAQKDTETDEWTTQHQSATPVSGRASSLEETLFKNFLQENPDIADEWDGTISPEATSPSSSQLDMAKLAEMMTTTGLMNDKGKTSTVSLKTDDDAIFDEVARWRKSYDLRRSEIDRMKAPPNILKIDQANPSPGSSDAESSPKPQKPRVSKPKSRTARASMEPTVEPQRKSTKPLSNSKAAGTPLNSNNVPVKPSGKMAAYLLDPIPVNSPPSSSSTHVRRSSISKPKHDRKDGYS